MNQFQLAKQQLYCRNPTNYSSKIAVLIISLMFLFDEQSSVFMVTIAQRSNFVTK